LGVARIVRASITIVAADGNTGTTENVIAGIGITSVIVVAARRVISVDTTNRGITRGGLASCVIVTIDLGVRTARGRVANIRRALVVVVARYIGVFASISVITTVVRAKAIIIAGNIGENTTGRTIAIGGVARIRGGTIDRSVRTTSGG
jgi:hypothetical protein